MVISACMVLAVSCKEEDNVVSEFSIDKTEMLSGPMEVANYWK